MAAHRDNSATDPLPPSAEQIRRLMEFIEAVRRRKRKAARDKRKFSQDALAEQFRGYRNALRRPAQAVMVSREQLREIGNYLEMNTAEQNEAMQIAGYVPDHIYPIGADLDQALRICEEVMIHMPMPAYVLRPDWSVYRWNRYILRLLGWNDAMARLLQANDALNVLYLIFDSEWGMRNAVDNWEEVARRNIYGFKMTNYLAQHELWYKAIEDRIRSYPGGRTLWDEVKVSSEPIRTALEYVTTLNLEPYRVSFRSLFVCPGDFHYPHVAAYLPIDHETWRVFSEIGCPIVYQYGMAPHDQPGVAGKM